MDFRPATLAVPMMLPPGYGFCSEVLSMAREPYFAARKTDKALVFMTFMKPALSSSQNTLPLLMPAFAKKTSNLPYLSSASCTTFLTEGSSEASKVRV